MTPMHETEPGSVSAALIARLREDIAQAGGWIPFERFMHTALYTPQLGYYARGDSPIGLMPAGSRGAGPNGTSRGPHRPVGAGVVGCAAAAVARGRGVAGSMGGSRRTVGGAGSREGGAQSLARGAYALAEGRVYGTANPDGPQVDLFGRIGASDGDTTDFEGGWQATVPFIAWRSRFL
jgi:hypothetical protein